MTGYLFRNGLILTLLMLVLNASPCLGEDRFITLVYHDIVPRTAERDDLTEKEFINQIEYLRSHGYNFISAEQVIRAAGGGATLPDNAILLTFDDAYKNFYSFVYPLLRLYKIPAVLSVVTSWIDNPATSPYRNKQFMNWSQIKEISDHGLITVATHSNGLHTLLRANPSGNLEPAPSSLLYLPEGDRYETVQEFRSRIRSDLLSSINSLNEKTGKKPRILTWPYGSYNLPGTEEAKKLGFEMILTLDEGYSETNRLDRVQRYYLSYQHDWLSAFKDARSRNFRNNPRIRGVQVDMDMLVNKNSYEESDLNLGLLINRLLKLGVNTVFMQGFCDKTGTGNISSVYFPNSVLPVEIDFLSHAVNRIRARGIKVFVWMPALSYELPDPALNESLKVKEWQNGATRVSTSWYRRLSPFAPETIELTGRIFSELASTVNFDGILIQDDAYLSETEDFHPAAIAAFHELYGVDPGPPALAADRKLSEQWNELKIESLDKLVAELAKKVKIYRPGASIARNIYSMPITNPDSRAWFSQDFKHYLKEYDLTVVMAYAPMEGEDDSRKWYRKLFDAAGGVENSSRLLFKLQAYDWQKRKWLSETELKSEMTFLLALGARHIAYYPDNVHSNIPEPAGISSILSSKNEARLNPPPPVKNPAGFLERLFMRFTASNP